jgi:hypothetical protein
MDTDWVTRKCEATPESVIKELKKKFGKQLEVYELEPEFGFYRARLNRPGRPSVSVDIMTATEEVMPEEWEQSPMFKGVDVATLGRYFRSKLDCVETRRAPKDLFHLCALAQLPGWEPRILRGLARLDQDAVLENLALTREKWNTEDEGRNLFPAIPGTRQISDQEFMGWLDKVEAKVLGTGGAAGPALLPLPAAGKTDSTQTRQPER